MHLTDKARTVPRLHLIGTLVIVTLLTVWQAAFFTWQNVASQRESLERIDEAVTRQMDARLEAEMRSAMGYLAFTRERTESLLRDALVEQVDMALDIAWGIYRSQIEIRPEEEVRQLIVEALRPARFFDGRGYYFVDDMEGRFILLPTAPDYEGQLLPDNRDDTGHYIMRGLIEAARKPPGEGFSRYRWYRPDDPARMADKLAYVRYFEPFDWLIGTGDYTYEWETRQQHEVLERLRSLRFGRSGYIGVLDPGRTVLLSPGDASIEGQVIDALPSIERTALDRILERAGRGAVSAEYDWIHPDSGELARKRALLERDDTWGWILVATVFEDELRGLLADERMRQDASGFGGNTTRLLLMLSFSLLVALVGSLLFSRWSRGLFRAYHYENKMQREALERQAIELLESERKLATILDSVEAFIYIKDPQHRYVYANRAICRVFGLEPQDVVGKSDETFFDEITARAIRANDMRVLVHGERVAEEEMLGFRHEDASRTFMSIKIPLRRDDGEIYALCGISTDMSERRAMEDEIRQLAFYDALTGLANRKLLIDRLQQMLVICGRTSQYGALIFIDLDNFKTLNDTLGHDKGDQLLQQVAMRLGFCAREEDTVARFGGDEFALMLGYLGTDPEDAAARAKRIAEKVLDALRQPFSFGGRQHFSTPSIGITLFHGRDARVEDILKQADLAMYQAKASGRDTLSFFDPEMQARLSARAGMEADLRDGLAKAQFVLHYQPQVGSDGQLVGAEALLRWNHPERGEVAPDQFITLAEETGQILQIGNWVLLEACAQLRSWSNDPKTRVWTLAVNVSARQFHQRDFVERVLDALRLTGADPSRLKLELTETLLLDDMEDTVRKMSALKAHGVGFALDDFGTGYSSMTYLKRLPLDQLKIDRSFVRDLLVDPNDAAIARAIITLADTLGLSVVAEGVETVAQRDFLVLAGCRLFQGYLFGRPGPVEALRTVRPLAVPPALP